MLRAGAAFLAQTASKIAEEYNQPQDGVEALLVREMTPINSCVLFYILQYFSLPDLDYF